MIGSDATTGRALDGDAHLHQSVQTILSTPIGSRTFRREFGSELPRLVDRSAGPSNRLRIVAASAAAVRRWEPRIRVTRVRTRVLGDRVVAIDVHGTRRVDGRPVVLEGLIL